MTLQDAINLQQQIVNTTGGAKDKAVLKYLEDEQLLVDKMMVEWGELNECRLQAE